MIQYIWLILIALTLFAFLLGWLELMSSVMVIILLITTFIKGQLVIDYFMGLKNTHLKYRLIPTLWLTVVVSLIALAYFFPAN